jgi:hypothetical protein
MNVMCDYVWVMDKRGDATEKKRDGPELRTTAKMLQEPGDPRSCRRQMRYSRHNPVGTMSPVFPVRVSPENRKRFRGQV